MGICFSCLGLHTDDGDYNERSSLLGNNNVYSDEDVHESLLKQQQRQNELSVIVNDLSDNLIDVSTFLSKQSSENYGNNKNTMSSTQSTDVFATASSLQGTEVDTSIPTETPISPSDGVGDSDKGLPHLWPADKKLQLLKDISMSHTSFNVEPPSQSLYVVF